MPAAKRFEPTVNHDRIKAHRQKTDKRTAALAKRVGVKGYSEVTVRWVEPWSLKDKPPGYKPKWRKKKTGPPG
jgi:hypothetical protein